MPVIPFKKRWSDLTSHTSLILENPVSEFTAMGALALAWSKEFFRKSQLVLEYTDCMKGYNQYQENKHLSVACNFVRMKGPALMQIYL